MKVKKLFRYRNITRAVLVLAGVYLCLRYAPECSRGIRNGTLFCVEVLVPSLYVFMALSAYFTKSGLAVTLTRPFGGVTKALFGLPPSAAAVILSYAVGGYPVGARCAAILYEEGMMSEDEARKTAYIAVCAGPGFLLNYVGGALLGCQKAGVVLLIAQIMGMLMTGVIVGKTLPIPIGTHPYIRPNKQDDLLIRSVSDASRATLQMCAMVVLCSALIEVVSKLSTDSMLTDIASAVLEITAGCQRLCGSYPLYLTAFFIGFGGLSVHLQIYAGLGELRINKGLFFLFRIIQGIITAACAYILFMMIPVEVGVFNSAEVPLTAAKSATLAGSSALVFCGLCFIGSLRKLEQRQL